MTHVWILAVAILGGDFASPATIPAAAAIDNSDHATINGDVSVQINGRRAGCRGALLIPQSSAADRDIRLSFGNNQRGFKVLDGTELQLLNSTEGEKIDGSRQVSCKSYPWNFSFEGVKPGKYYLTALVSASGERFVTGEMGEIQKAVVMQHITVEPGQNMRVLMKD